MTSPRSIRPLSMTAEVGDPLPPRCLHRRAPVRTEMKHIFENGWVYLAHESQIPAVNDYTTWPAAPWSSRGTRPAKLHAFVNACSSWSHDCRRKHGNKGSFTCPFHGWTFSNNGKLLKVKDGKRANIPPLSTRKGRMI
jgi:benzoate/toluate 1,2-dioxygenase alpha subunit